MKLALYQPDIPQNLGSALRLAACMQVGLEVIEPCGFILDDKRIRRAGMDYIDYAALTRHNSWQEFLRWRNALTPPPRIVLLTTKGSESLPEFTFRSDDILLAGRESAGVPDEVAASADARVRIPMQPEARSLNVVVSLAMVLSLGLQQTAGFCKNEKHF
ncbi:MAG: tRNA (cytidine(34)-2'-O)-methyltransferase [Alphaproteobacteria bacterium]|nr:tRNA (cytidine(34)-2'-O)-methyltransferase [Alphaproteobacteria bacterium]